MADLVRALRSLNLTEEERNLMKSLCLFTIGSYPGVLRWVQGY